MIKWVRILFWLAVVLAVLIQFWQEYLLSQWQAPLQVALYPINADASPVADAYIHSLSQADFEGISAFFAREALRYHMPLSRPISVHLGPEVHDVPPAPPAVSGYWLDILTWSLKFRWFSWSHAPEMAVPIDIKLYLLYYDPRLHPHLLHSTALHKGKIGRVNLYAENSQHATNAVVIAHELLHTLSASDKYDLHNGQPLFPQGYAEPYAQPLYPQSMAELMAGKVPHTAAQSRMAKGLDEVVIGRPTAREIGWSH